MLNNTRDCDEHVITLSNLLVLQMFTSINIKPIFPQYNTMITFQIKRPTDNYAIEQSAASERHHGHIRLNVHIASESKKY